MDTRLYILAGTFLFLVVSLIYLVVALVRARKAPDVPTLQPESSWPMLNPAPPELEAAASRDRTFAEPTSGMAAVLKTPLRTGEWRPAPPEQRLPRTSTVDDYWDALIDEDALLVKPVSAQSSVRELWPDAPVPTPVPEVVQAADAPHEPAEPTVEPVPAPVPAKGAPADVVTAQAAAIEDVRTVEARQIEDIVAELEAEPAPAPAPQPQPAPPAVAPQPVTSQPEPIPQPAPQPAVTPQPQPAATVAPQPVAQLPGESEVAPRPQETAPPPAPAEPQASPARPAPPEPVRAPVAVVAAPRPAVVIHTPSPTPVVPTPAESRVPATPRPAARSALVEQSERSSEGRDEIPAHELVAPVEMWFGDVRIGVKAGTKTYDRFQKIAQVLFDDLKHAAPR